MKYKTDRKAQANLPNRSAKPGSLLTALNAELLANQQQVQDWANSLDEAMKPLNSSQRKYQIDIIEDEERHIFYPRVGVVHHGVRKDYVFTLDFIQSADYSAFTSFGTHVSTLIQNDGVVKKAKIRTDTRLQQALEWLQKEALVVSPGSDIKGWVR